MYSSGYTYFALGNANSVFETICCTNELLSKNATNNEIKLKRNGTSFYKNMYTENIYIIYYIIYITMYMCVRVYGI